MEAVDPLSIEALEQIDQICCRFERELKQSKRLELNDYLAGIEGAERTALLVELLSLDIDYRRRRLETVTLEDYASLSNQDQVTVQGVLEQLARDARSGTNNGAGAETARAETRTADSEPELPPQIGRYRILNRIAAGGSGVVLRGFDDELQRDVAIKVPHREVVSMGQLAARFLTEARLVANLHHPAIVPVYDVGRTEKGHCYVVSKFMEGGDLSSRLRRNALSSYDAASIVQRIAEALHYAHSRGLIHRDIKPSNLLADAEGQVYLGDFGAAIQGYATPSFGFVGTPAYMSPEQARGENHLVDARTDVFSLGVVLYELTTGKRPFRNQNVSQLLTEVIAAQPDPPRQWNPNISPELERITLKAMSKRASDRYQTARELVQDLREWMAAEVRESETPQQPHSEIIPKGLRSFEATDAEFFLRLLPGPRDRQGVPETIRFWQARIEETLPGRAFRIGVVYGPSGCGKSSLVKAGLLPRLGSRIHSIYIEARKDSTEADLIAALRRSLGLEGGSPDLPDLLRTIRNEPIAPQQKVLIVIDQFEQWLHAHRELANAQLASALRQCDGVRLQCLLLVRDDFWMPLVRFMSEVEVTPVEHANTMAVDLFDLNHAKKVLIRFGQAYERLPSDLSNLTRDHVRFLDEALRSLEQDGTINPICLSLFVEMTKNEAWEPATLRRVGGTEGLGLRYLQRCFSPSHGLPRSRQHEVAVRNVLRALLPETGMEIRVHLRSYEELLVASGYLDRPERFDELLQLLDQQLRLITATDPALGEKSGEPSKDQPDVRESDSSVSVGQRSSDQYFQLSHDFMVAPMREWVTREQRQTLRGRAELCLDERTTLWSRKQEARQVPGLLEWIQIRLFTNPSSWNPLQQRMLQQAARRSLVQLCAAIACLGLLSVLSWDMLGKVRAHSALTTVQRADANNLLTVIHDIRSLKRWMTPLLQREVARADRTAHDRRNFRLALLADDPDQATALYEEFFLVDPTELRVLREGMLRYADTSTHRTITNSLWAVLQDPRHDSERRFRAACVLAGFDPQSPRWNEHSEEIATWLISMRIDQLTDWLLLLRPVSPSLISSLERVFLATDDFGGYQVASFVLANFLEGKEESERIVELIKRARPSQLPALLDTLRERGDDAAITLLKQEAQLSFANQDPALPTSNRRSPPDELLQPVLDAHGVVSTRFLMCQTLPISELAPVAESLREFGYRPIRIRPYQSRNQMLVAGIWTRDEHDWQLHVGITEAEVQELFSSSKTRQQFVTDLAAYHAQDGWKFILSFSSDPALSGDTRLAMAMPRTAWQSTFDTNADARFSPRTLQYATDPEGNVRLTQIWRRIGTRFMIEQRFSVTRERLRYGGTNYVPVDTAVHGDWNSKPFGAVWQTNPYLEVETLILESPSELAQRWIELYHQGFLPSVISVDGPSTREHPLSVSVWQRPMPTEDANRRFADIKSNILVALLSLGELDTVLPSLKTSSDPTLRSHIIHKTTKAHVPIRVLLSCLGDESLDAGTRQALILATGGYPRLSVPVKEREQILGLMNVLVCEDPDAGVHSAAEWLLRRWEGDLPAIPPHDPATVATRQWFVNSHGQTFAVLKFPDGFRTAGALSPPSGHHFALMTSEVTVRQFAAFRPDHRFSRDVAKEESCPANTMDWYAAAEFCNWLSQQEGLPESEWCYAPNEQGEYAVGMTIASDYLERRGYRLPLAAEWLYAASDATQSRYFFGSDPALLGDYAWFAKNAQGVLHPVAELLPSRFGFFDMYGNVKEWSQSMDKPTVDEYHVTNDAQRSVLGASFVHLEAHINANLGKHGNPPRLREDRNGFRVARTIFP